MFENRNLKCIFEPKNEENYNSIFREIINDPDKLRIHWKISYIKKNNPRGQEVNKHGLKRLCENHSQS